MNGRQILVVLAGVAALYFALAYLYEKQEPDASDCSGEFRKDLPYCTTQEWSGSYLTVINSCDFDITVRWDFLAGNEYIQTLAPGEQKRMATFPVKITSVSCCSNYNWCF